MIAAASPVGADDLYIPVNQIRRLPEFGQSRLSPSTIFRWTHRGVRGRRLRTVLIGGRRFTTRDWLDQFLNHDPDVQPTPEARPTARREREVAAAQAHLATLGI